MLAIFDHIIALMVTGVIVLLLFQVQQRAQETSLERTMMYTAKSQTLDFASIIERDLMNMGREEAPVEPPILEYNTTPDGITDTLVFWGVGASGERARIAYGVGQTGTGVIDGDTLALYEMRRYERRGANYVRVGGSTPTLTRFRIDLLTDGNTPTDPSTARWLRVRISNGVMPEFEYAGLLQGYRQLHWGSTINIPGVL